MIREIDGGKNYGDLPTDTYLNTQKDVGDVHNVHQRRGKHEEYYDNYTIPELNTELDKNRIFIKM